MAQHTRDYYHILFLTEHGTVTKSAHTKAYADKIVMRLRDEYGECPGRMARQTWAYTDVEGPTRVISEEILETYQGWQPEVKATKSVPMAPRFAMKAEWPARRKVS